MVNCYTCTEDEWDGPDNQTVADFREFETLEEAVESAESLTGQYSVVQIIDMNMQSKLEQLCDSVTERI